MTDATLTDAERRKARLRAEFALFYLAAPLAMALALPPNWMFPMLFALTAVGLVLLARTPGFRWRELVAGTGRVSWGLIVLVAMATWLAGYRIIQETAPGAYLFLPRQNPQLMLMIALLYPFLSALPQELIFRPLFFRRYGPILPASPLLTIPINAAVFSFAHLMYWSWVVLGLTFAGGLVFAASYRIRGNFPEAVVAHSIAGVLLFTLGLGIYFYSGNVTRPF